MNIATLVRSLSREMGLELNRDGSKTVKGKHGVKAAPVFHGKTEYGALAYATDEEGQLSVCVYFGKHPQLTGNGNGNGKEPIYLILEKYGQKLYRDDAHKSVRFLGKEVTDDPLQGEYDINLSAEAMKLCQELFPPFRRKNGYRFSLPVGAV